MSSIQTALKQKIRFGFQALSQDKNIMW